MKTIFGLTIFVTAMTAVIPLTRKFSPGIKWYSMVFLTVGAFGGIAINQVNQPFFGMTFQLLTVATALLAFAHFFSNPKTFWIGPITIVIFSLYWLSIVRMGQFLSLALGVAIVLSIYCFAKKIAFSRMLGLLSSGILAVFCWEVTKVDPFHNYMNRIKGLSGPSGVSWRQSGPHDVYQLLRSLKKGGSLPLVWFSNYSWVDANTVGWEAAKDGVPWKMYNSVDLERGSVPITDMAEILVVSEPGVLGELETPHLQTARELEINLKMDSRFGIVGIISDPNGKQMTIFSRVSTSKLE
jgi:hypothetical protein